jgi:hypothetical protein
MQFKLGFGPMSDLIVDTLATYASNNQQPLMIIASRNQVDAASGYVMTTEQLAKQITPLRSDYLMLCRDHCGPYFLDSEKKLSLAKAVEATKKTIAADIESGFDLIHIDTSRCDNGYEVADELINFCIRLNPNIKFEFGTEENVGVAAGIEKYQNDVKFASQYPNMEYVVAQTGSLTMEDRQVGGFDVSIVKKLVGFANSAGVKLKEHNADYLTSDQIALRQLAGVHALNIAPQLGVVKTKLIIKMAEDSGISTDDFKNTVLNSGKWKKWHIDCDDTKKVEIAGHYCYHTTEFQTLINQLAKRTNWSHHVSTSISEVLDLYYENLK